MSWSRTFSHKRNVALLLSSVMVLTIISTLISRRVVGRIGESFSSIYKDRLLPAVDLLYLNENLHGKRLLLERHLLAPDGQESAAISDQLKRFDYKIDSLVQDLRQTYLTPEEVGYLQAFTRSQTEYARLEADILRRVEANDRAGATTVFTRDGGTVFRETTVHLNELAHLQTVEGEELLHGVQDEAAYLYVITALQIGLCLVIGVLVASLLWDVFLHDRHPETKEETTYLRQ
jgi:hypothetical protein